jgi:hypothetical protein
MATKKTAKSDTATVPNELTISDATILGMVSRRAEEASSHWNKEFDLEKTREANLALYNSENIRKKLRDERYEDIFSDNKLFTSIRTILTFSMNKMAQPEITPSSGNALNMQFAQDFEKVLVEEADKQYGLDKVKLAFQDLLKGQRVGILKWLYDGTKLKLEHADPKSVIIGKRSALHDEPDFIRHKQKRTVAKLIGQFPDKKDDIYKHFEINKGVPSQLEKEVDIYEDWIWIEDKGSQKLVVVFSIADSLLLGKMVDPNWADGKNLLDEHTSPFIFFNVLNNGSGYIDETSFIEMAQYNQQNYDKRGKTIVENAAYAGTGVPVFGKGAVKEETAAQVKFSPTQRVLLDTEDVTKSFTTWTAAALPNYIFEDKQDARESVLDIFGTNQVQSGSANGGDTLGQDVMLRNQAEGRQQELVQCIDNAMQRFYQVLAQLIYRYFDDDAYYNFLGEDGTFTHIALTQDRISKNLGLKIKIKSGSSLPVDRSQKFAQAIELAKINKIGTLRLYRELGMEDPEQAYKEFLEEQLMPQQAIDDANKTIESKEAQEDLQLVIAGKQPVERDDLSEEYINYLNDYLLTQQYEQLPQAAQGRVSAFVAGIIAQAERKLLKLSMQQGMPTPPTDPATGQPMPQDPNAGPVPVGPTPDILGAQGAAGGMNAQVPQQVPAGV